MKLNCDLGESFGSWTMGADELLMPHIDMANIACGFHAGDPTVIKKTLALAKQHNLEIGAHPSYPDLQGFGRRSMQCSEDEIIDLLHYQIAALDGMALNQGLTLSYVKPHGALYNDMMKHPHIRSAIYKAMANYHKPLKLMLLATAKTEALQLEAKQFDLALYFEAFADRCYDDDGKLLARTQADSVLSKQEMLMQVEQLIKHQTLTTVSGKQLKIKADTICVHGDTPSAIDAIKQIKALCHG